MNNEYKYCYKNLGDGRKFFLFLSWLGPTGISLFLGREFFNGSFEKIEHVYVALGLWLFFVLLASWVHYAVVKRKTKHIAFLAFIHIIPFANIIWTIFLYFIYKVSKSEINDPTQLILEPSKPVNRNEGKDPWVE